MPSNRMGAAEANKKSQNLSLQTVNSGGVVQVRLHTAL